MPFTGFGQNLPEDLDPIRNLALALTTSAPKEIVVVCVGARRDASQFLGHIVRQKSIDRRACFALHLLLVQEERIVVAQLVSGQTGGIAGAQSAPAKKLQIGARTAGVA